MDSFVAEWHISTCLLTHVSPFLPAGGGGGLREAGKGGEKEEYEARWKTSTHVLKDSEREKLVFESQGPAD